MTKYQVKVLKVKPGNKIDEIIVCCACSQDTAGNHEWNCPDHPHKRLWGILRGIKVEPEEIENAKHSLFPDRDF